MKKAMRIVCLFLAVLLTGASCSEGAGEETSAASSSPVIQSGEPEGVASEYGKREKAAVKALEKLMDEYNSN